MAMLMGQVDAVVGSPQGKSGREIRRCLIGRVSLARQMDRLLERSATNQAGS
jgi:hypothetical protein